MKTDNELIAEFMGWRFVPIIEDPDNGTIEYAYWTGPSLWMKGATANYEVLQFDRNWDWLMPVVEKIAKIETNDIIRNGEDSYFDSYFPRTFGMINSETKEFMVRINRNPLHQATSLIEATHKAVVEFIKWYANQQTP